MTIAGESHKVPRPFLVMATQNPIETEGTYPLPEAQVDRFMMKVLIGYPTEEEEFVIVDRVTGVPPVDRLGGQHRGSGAAPEAMPPALRRSVAGPACRPAGGRDARPGSLRRPRHGKVPDVRCEPAGLDQPDRGVAGAGDAARRSYVWPEDLTDLAPDVLRHRLVLSYEALSDGQSADAIVHRILQALPAPEKTARSPCPGRLSRRSLRRPAPQQAERHGETRREAAAPDRVHRGPATRGLASWRLPDIVPRLRPRPRGLARVPVPRRRPAHRLERHRQASTDSCP